MTAQVIIADTTRSLRTVHWVIAIIVITGLIRVGLASVIGLGNDEAYTVTAARHFSLSYFDHPPLHLWLVNGWSHLLRTESPLMLRLPFIALFAGSTWFMFLLTRMLFCERAALWAVVAFNLAPVFSLTTASWILPDGPLDFFLLAGACILARILIIDPDNSQPKVLWMAAGLLAGFALLSKYSAILVIVGALAYILTVPTARRWLATPGPWVAVFLALLLFAPVVIWNAQHDWVSFAFQGARGQPEPTFKFDRTAQFIAGNAAYLLPWVFLPMLYVLWRALKRGRSNPRSWFLLCLSLGPLVVFTTVALWARALPHWTMPGWLFVFPLFGWELARLEETQPRLVRCSGTATAILMIVVMAALGTQAMTGWMTRLFKIDPIEDVLNWSAVKYDLDRRGLLQNDLFIAGLRWHTTGRLAYAMGPAIQVYCLCEQPHQFSLDADLGALRGRSAIIAIPEKLLNRELPKIAKMFQNFEVLPSVSLMRGNQPSTSIALVRGTRFDPISILR